jgi:hypothetical protein
MNLLTAIASASLGLMGDGLNSPMPDMRLPQGWQAG